LPENNRAIIEESRPDLTPMPPEEEVGATISMRDLMGSLAGNSASAKDSEPTLHGHPGTPTAMRQKPTLT